jgi:lipid A disaccharide synthetase
VPLVAVFRVPWLGWNLLGRWVVRARTFALVNWLHPRREHVVPEFIPWFGDPQPVAELVIGWLRNPETLAAQRAAQAAVVDPLRKKGASENAARMVVEMVESDKVTRRGR